MAAISKRHQANMSTPNAMRSTVRTITECSTRDNTRTWYNSARKRKPKRKLPKNAPFMELSKGLGKEVMPVRDVRLERVCPGEHFVDRLTARLEDHSHFARSWEEHMEAPDKGVIMAKPNGHHHKTAQLLQVCVCEYGVSRVEQMTQLPCKLSGTGQGQRDGAYAPIPLWRCVQGPQGHVQKRRFICPRIPDTRQTCEDVQQGAVHNICADNLR